MCRVTPPTKLSAQQPQPLRDLIFHYRNLYLPSQNYGVRARAPHPGDVLYWLGAVGGMAAILFVATR